MSNKTEQQAPSIDELIDLGGVARITGLRERTISAYVASGAIPSRRVGYARLFVRREIEDWNARRLWRLYAKRNRVSDVDASDVGMRATA